MSNFAQILRLIWIDGVLEEDGEINRADITRAFRVSIPQASADLSAYRRRHPGHIYYDTSAKCWRRIEGHAALYSRAIHEAANDAVRAVDEATK